MNVAVVGASNNPAKYGNRIVMHLAAAGHRVFPVNTHDPLIMGLPAVKKVGDIEHALDLVNIVVPPRAALAVVRHIRGLGGMNVWLQPGAESPEVERYLDKHRSEFGRVILNQCIMTGLDAQFPGHS